MWASKASSFHLPLPTKEDLAAAVIRRLAEELSEWSAKELEKDPDPVRFWTKAFSRTAYSKATVPWAALRHRLAGLPETGCEGVKGLFKCQNKPVA